MTLSARNHLKGIVDEVQMGDVVAYIIVRIASSSGPPCRIVFTKGLERAAPVLYRRMVVFIQAVNKWINGWWQSVRDGVLPRGLRADEQVGSARTWSWISESWTSLAAHWVSPPRLRQSTRRSTSSLSVKSSPRGSQL